MTGVFAANELKQGLQNIASGIGSVTASAAESQSVQAQLAAVLLSTGEAAGLSAKDLNEMAGAFQKTTTFSDEAVGSAQNLLLTFTNIKGDTFRDATGAVLDMSQALGQDLQSSAVQLGKALQDPIEGITALRRVGVAFSDDQQAVIDKMVKSGDLMGAQRMILEELAKEFGGSASAATHTFSGHMAQLHNELDRVKESLGGGLIDAFMALPQGMQLALVVGKDLAPTIAQLGLAAAALGPRLLEATKAVWGFNMAVTANPVVIAVAAIAILVGALVLLVTHWDEVKAAAEQFWTGLKLMAADAINPVIAAINNMIKAWNALPFHEKVGEIGMMNTELRNTGSAGEEAAAGADKAAESTRGIGPAAKVASDALQALRGTWEEVNGVFMNAGQQYFGATANNPAFANSLPSGYASNPAYAAPPSSGNSSSTSNVGTQNNGVIINGDVNVTQPAGESIDSLLSTL